MKLTITVGNVQLELDEPELINEALVGLGYGSVGKLIDQAACSEDPMSAVDRSLNTPAPALRSPPDPGVRDSVVQYRSSDNSGPLCEECQEPIAPLDEDSALELYSRVLCLSCGKELE